jgi:hypothetical protein
MQRHILNGCFPAVASLLAEDPLLAGAVDPATGAANVDLAAACVAAGGGAWGV